MVAPAAEKDNVSKILSLCLSESCQKQILWVKKIKSGVFNDLNNFSVLRGAIHKAKVKIVLFFLVVDVETPGDLIFEVAVDMAGVVEDLELPHSGDAQQYVLVVDERLVLIVQRLVIVPFSPVEAIQQ